MLAATDVAMDDVVEASVDGAIPAVVEANVRAVAEEVDVAVGVVDEDVDAVVRVVDVDVGTEVGAVDLERVDDVLLPLSGVQTRSLVREGGTLSISLLEHSVCGRQARSLYTVGG